MAWGKRYWRSIVRETIVAFRSAKDSGYAAFAEPKATVIHRKSVWQPKVRGLEPRIVLNATAELNPLGQLLIVGTGFDDSLRVDFQNDSLQIFDDVTGQVIPISGHPDGLGNESSPLRATDITSGNVRFELGSGDDSISLPLLGELNVVVLGETGTDTTELRLAPSDDPTSDPATGSLLAESDQITLTASQDTLSFGQSQVELIGHVRFAPSISDPHLTIDNRLAVLGPLTLSTDTVFAGSGQIDLDQSMISADSLEVDLHMAMNGGVIRLGDINANAGHRLSHLSVDSASSLIVGDHQVTVADGIVLDADEVTVLGDLMTSDADIQVSSSDRLTIANQSHWSVGEGSILLSGGGGEFIGNDSVLHSDSTGDAIVFQDYSEVTLGEVRATEGQLVLGREGREIQAVGQAQDSVLLVDRIRGEIQGDADLTNASNQIQTVVDFTAGGNVAMVDSTEDLLIESLRSSNGTVEVMAAGGIAIGRVEAATSSVTLRADQITDATDDVPVDDIPIDEGQADVVAQAVRLQASRGIGSPRGIELLGTTDLFAVNETGDVTITSLGNASLAVHQLTTSGGTASITTTGDSSDILVGQILVADGGDVSLVSSDDLLNLSNTSLLQADDLRLIAGNATADQMGDQAAAIDLRVDVRDLAARVVGNHRGDLLIDHVSLLNPIRIGALEPMETNNGQIIIRSATGIEVVDLTPGDGGVDRKDNPELVARSQLAQGEFGRVDLDAPIITLGDDVQIHGEQVFQPTVDPAIPRRLGDLSDAGGNRASRTIYLAADEIHWGDEVELFTGNDQGTARTFLPRSSGDLPSAFFDPASVRTNVLTQALQNDAEGILSIDIGAPGERGLTATIDWGDSNPRRFQQVDGLKGEVDFTHLYLEEDTLESRSNGRSAATDPYSVRFAIRQHGSIVVESRVEGGTTLVSQDGITRSIVGGLVSSTDNLLTRIDAGPALETGSAEFIIPALSIPVAFFPVRDVIPQWDSPEIILVADSPTEVTTATLELTEVATTTVVSREEFLRLRILSPDPSGEDLAPPEKLPSDIFAGDRLKDLFSRLPDGSYEIEYVIGDGNQRSLLRVEVRDGEATIAEEALNEGTLRLKPIENDRDQNTDSPLSRSQRFARRWRSLQDA